MAEEGIGQSRSASGARRTRSQAAPDWSAMDELILVNEIAAVEADCLKALSSYQKWKIIAENCAAQDVSRSLNQYRRKWDSLIADYNSIKKWESRSWREPYWLLRADRREELGLPRNFDNELFVAIGNLVRARENQSDTEPESDGEAKDEMVDVAKELGAIAVTDTSTPKHNKVSKRKRQQPTSQEKRARKNLAEEELSESFAKEKPLKSHIKGKPPRSHAEKNRMQSTSEEKPMRNPQADGEKPQLRSTKKMPQKGHIEEKETISIEIKDLIIEENPVRNPTLEEEKPQNPQNGNLKHVEEDISTEDKERMLALILRENAERISSIVAEGAVYGPENAVGADQDRQTESAEFIRQQGDKLIACLGDMVKTLDRLCDIVR